MSKPAKILVPATLSSDLLEIPNHVALETPGSIHEGSELGSQAR